MLTEFFDRQAGKPNRFKVIPEEGEPYYVTLQRADDVIISGTPLNARTFNNMLTRAACIQEENGGVDISLWVGSKEEYDSLTKEPNNCLCFITDDDSAEDQVVFNGNQVSNVRVNGLVSIDKSLSSASTNPVENKAVSNAVANALKGVVSGVGTVQLSKVSPIEHELDVRLSSKNQANHGEIIPNSYYRDTNYTTASGNWASRFEPFACKPSTTYTMSSNSLFYNIWWLDEKKQKITGAYLGGNYQPYTFTTAENCYYIAISVYNTKDGEPNPFEWLQLEEGTEATPYTPYMDVEGVKMNRYGKNLVSEDTMIANGWALQEDGTLYATGSQVLNKLFYKHNGTPGQITISYDCRATASNSCAPLPYITYTDGSYQRLWPPATTEPYHYTITSYGDKIIDKVTWTYGSDKTVGGWIQNVQVELGSVETAYEPYKGTEHTADADGIVTGVKSISPVTTLTTDVGVVITAEYNKDTVAVVNDLMERIAALEAAIVNN